MTEKLEYAWFKTKRGMVYRPIEPPKPKRSVPFNIWVEPEPSGGASREKGVLRSQTLPLNWPYANKHDERGRPVFTSMREQRECLAAAQSDGEPIVYDEVDPEEYAK